MSHFQDYLFEQSIIKNIEEIFIISEKRGDDKMVLQKIVMFIGEKTVSKKELLGCFKDIYKETGIHPTWNWLKNQSKNIERNLSENDGVTEEFFQLTKSGLKLFIQNA